MRRLVLRIVDEQGKIFGENGSYREFELSGVKILYLLLVLFSLVVVISEVKPMAVLGMF